MHPLLTKTLRIFTKNLTKITTRTNKSQVLINFLIVSITVQQMKWKFYSKNYKDRKSIRATSTPLVISIYKVNTLSTRYLQLHFNSNPHSSLTFFFLLLLFSTSMYHEGGIKMYNKNIINLTTTSYKLWHHYGTFILMLNILRTCVAKWE